MSKLAQNDTKKAVERRNQAMRMNYTKVKPTVVKHILPNEVMQIHNPTVSCLSPYDTIFLCYRSTRINSTSGRQRTSFIKDLPTKCSYPSTLGHLLRWQIDFQRANRVFDINQVRMEIQNKTQET